MQDRIAEELTLERIVGGLLTIVLGGLLLWVGATVSRLSIESVKLQANVAHWSAATKDLRRELRGEWQKTIETVQRNSAAIEIINDRMLQDDVRERSDSKALVDLNNRLSRAEVAAKKGS